MSALHLDILPAPQQRLWAELGAVPGHFVLYGGTAIALQLGHRQSIDFDFFTYAPLDVESLYLDVPWLAQAETLRQTPATLEPAVRERLIQAVRGVDLDRLPDPGPATRGIGT